MNKKEHLCNTHEVEIASTKKNSTATTIYKSRQEHAVLIIASATGVKQTYYKKFAEFISLHGITVITFDYQGIGKSLKQKISKQQNDAKEWGTIDIESIVDYTFKNYPNAKKYYIGHSIGGQLVGLSANANKFEKIILLAAQSGYWKYWKGFQRITMWLNWHVLFPTLIYIFGYMPSKKLNGMENLPKNVAKQWCKWAKNDTYLFSDLTSEETFYNKIKTKLTAIDITDDSFAPKEAVDWMTEKYKNADVKKISINPKNYNTKKIGHFGIFREEFKDSLWKLLLNEIN